MSETHQDTIFEELKKNYNFLVALTIGNMYSLFYYDHENTEVSFSHCNSLQIKNYSDICNCSNLINSAENAFEYLHGMIGANNLQKNSKWCEYLSYFVNDYIQNSELCNNTEQLYRELERLQIYYSTVSNNCNIKIFNISKDTFVKKKKLYFLSEILYWIEEEYGRISYVTQEIYNKFFKECVDIYKEIITDDDCRIKKEYDTELNNLIKNFNRTKAYLIGKNKSITHDNLQSPNALMCQQKLNENQPQEIPDRGETLGFNEEAGPTGPEDQTLAVELTGSSLKQRSVTRAEIEDPEVRMNDSDSEVSKQHTNDNISNSVGTILGTSLGFFVPLITIYKFTPLGSWINTKVLGRNKILKNMEINNQHLLLNGTENGEINLGDTMYRIKYNS